AEPGLPDAFGDEQRNWQVVTNLLSNAVKFSPADQPIEVTVTPDNGFLRVSVRDHGSGIAPEDQQRLFQKFERIVTPGARRSAGTGLGLYICRSIVEAQGGRIRVESTEGEGSTFSYTIPVAPGEG
ncbi:MAG: sensor histidine kinase, partial [Candidatus Binatia bacterium]